MHCSGAEFQGLAQEIFETGAGLRFQARGGSMHPSLRDGDYLLARPIPASELSKGDVVLCQAANGRLLVHRILARRERSDELDFLVKGDRCDKPDDWIPAAKILGKVVEIERAGARIYLAGKRTRFAGSVWALASSLNLWSSPVISWLYRVIRWTRRHISPSGVV